MTADCFGWLGLKIGPSGRIDVPRAWTQDSGDVIFVLARFLSHLRTYIKARLTASSGSFQNKSIDEFFTENLLKLFIYLKVGKYKEEQ